MILISLFLFACASREPIDTSTEADDGPVIEMNEVGDDGDDTEEEVEEEEPRDDEPQDTDVQTEEEPQDDESHSPDPEDNESGDDGQITASLCVSDVDSSVASFDLDLSGPDDYVVSALTWSGGELPCITVSGVEGDLFYIDGIVTTGDGSEDEFVFDAGMFDSYGDMTSDGYSSRCWIEGSDDETDGVWACRIEGEFWG